MPANHIHPMIDENCSTVEQIQFRKQFGITEFFIQDHIIQNQRVLPGVAYLEMARASAAISSKHNTFEIRNIDFLEMLSESSGLTKSIILKLNSENGKVAFSIEGNESGKIYCRGQINSNAGNQTADVKLFIAEIQNRCTSRLSRDEYYEILNQAGFQYGERFKATRSIQFNAREIIARMELPSGLDNTLVEFVLHPAMVDSAVQTAIGLTLLMTNNRDNSLFIPFSIAKCNVYRSTEKVMYVYSRLTSELDHDKKFAKYDVVLTDENGNICVEIIGLFLKVVESATAARQNANDEATSRSRAIMRQAVENMAQDSDRKEDHHSSVPVENASSNERSALPVVVSNDAVKAYAIHFLKTALSKSLNMPADAIDINQNVGKYGLNSLLIHELNNVLEIQFPDISKTLFFEYPTVQGLSDYLIENNKEQLVQYAGNAEENGEREEADSRRGPIESKEALRNLRLTEKRTTTGEEQIERKSDAISDSGTISPILIHEKELHKNAELREIITAIDKKTPPILYLRLIYPYLFISSKRNQYVRLFIQESKKVVVPCFPVGQEAGLELKEYCRKQGYRLLIVDEYHEWLDTEEFRLIPLGVWQDIDLNSFTLAGNKMRRLRYMVDKFKKSGDVTVEEYREDSDSPLAEMRALMIRWSKGKKFILRSTLTCMEELLQRKVQNGYRAFLTYFNGKLCSVIVIEKNKEGSYVMDQEFYDPEASPLGHLEYSISEIIGILKTEKASIFSLGLTWYPMTFAEHAKKDSHGWKWICEQFEQGTPLGKIFEQAQPNYQFKKKFGVTGDPFYAYLHKAEQASLLLEYWPVFPANSLTANKLESSLSTIELSTKTRKTHTIPVALNSEQSRRDYLDSGHKLIDIDYKDVQIDLLTDSWHHVKSVFVQQRIEHLDSLVATPAIEAFRGILPFKHFILTDQGRTAEELFYGVFPKARKKIYTAIPWSTTLMHQLNNKFEVSELPKKSALDFQSEDLHKGEIDVDQLKAILSKQEGNVALVGIEALNNGCGGVPIRLSHTTEVKKILIKYDVPLVLDASRIIRNSLLLSHYEDSLKNKSVWEIVQQSMKQADHILMSLTKDFATSVGGLIATNDDALAAALREEQKRRHYGLSATDELRILRAVSDHDLIEKLNRDQLAFTKKLGGMLTHLGVPVLKPTYGHAILVDVSSLVKGESILEKKEKFLDEFYIKTGVRAGIHQSGKQKNTVLDNCIRLAFAIGQSEQEHKLIQATLQSYFRLLMTQHDVRQIHLPTSDSRQSIVRTITESSDIRKDHVTLDKSPVYTRPQEKQEKMSDSKPAEYDRHSNDATFPSQKSGNDSSLAKSGQVNRKPVHDRPESQDIAIIGLAGRYPHAKNITEFWENLKAGKDCISEIPSDRWNWKRYFHPDRNQADGIGKTYGKWGGFIADVDKFDPLFFNISPAEAELMDPQERLFLETAWEALEDAGYSGGGVNAHAGREPENRIGVFAGATWQEYQLLSRPADNRGTALLNNPCNIANRVSYFCDFNGSSLTVDTACSSSLTAIHLACASLIQGVNKMAIAGGVNLSLHPNKYLSLAKFQFLSTKGFCESFGQGGDGYVPAEGVGAVLLKPLVRAIADGDHIYGVIKSTAVNHGGKANGYTVPNPNRHTSLIRSAIDQAGINPRTISYIEAHGTGTLLGDPIEITGLTKAFRKYTQDSQFCAIGSAKSNIGHCESAAGIAGLTKVLLQLKYRQLAPSLHSAVLNQNIDFRKTPFVVQQELAEWKRPVIEINGEKREYPRIAGVSSFGAWGSNAHVLIEEYIPKDHERASITITTQNPAIIVLSAKTEERLITQVKQLMDAIRKQQLTDFSLADMAYTLQIGREAMDERLALIVGSIKELEEKLESYLERKNGIPDLYRGQSKRNKETLAAFAADEELQEAIDKWLQRKKYAKLLDFWVNGLMFDWNKLYGDASPRRMSLPTYPFARERYWVTEVNAQETGVRSQKSEVGGQVIHPLLHQNTSDLSEQRFSSTFTGQEFFLADHVVKGKNVLPGVAYLEMARAAVEQAAGALDEGRTRIRLKNVGWVRPIIVGDQPVQVHIGLFPEDGGEISYQIYILPEGNGAEPIEHSLGSAVLSSISEVPVLDLKSLQAQCTQGSLSSIQCYEAFKTMGLEYGPAHQGIEKVYVGNGQVLAKLTLPPSVSGTQGQFVLHPSMLDSALQASLALMISPDDLNARVPLKPVVPYALQELEIISNCTSNMWSFVRYSDGSKAGDNVQKLDIEVCDETGNVCVRMKGFTLRVLDGEVGSLGSSAALGTFMVEPSWKEQAVVREAAATDYSKHLIMLCEPGSVSQKDIENQMKGVRCIIMQSQQKGIEERFQSYATQVFEEIRSILNDKPKGKVLVQIVVPADGEQRTFSGLSGLLKTAHLENPKITGQMIELDTYSDAQKIREKLKENSNSPNNTHIRYESGKRYIAVWREIESAKEAGIPWKDQGVYLITGGVGGLGLIFAKTIAQNVKDATLILTGRSPLKDDKQAQLKELESLGSRIVYKKVDVIRKEAVTDLIQNIKEKYGQLNGIIHAAGVIRDNFIIKKTTEEFGKVLTPKVPGLVNLDQASKDLKLDFFISFSSITGGLGNIGQSDYSTANAFMDAYAQYRNNLSGSNQRKGQTLSISWPLWKEGGMHVDEATEKMLRESMGMISMQTETGLRALYQALASRKAHVMVMEGDLKRLHTTLFDQQSSKEILPSSSAGEKSKVTPTAAQDLLQEKATQYFKKLLSSVIKLPPHQIEADASMEKYGIDSIMVMQLTNVLEKTFGSLSKTLFFEYQSIQAISGYFLESHRDQLIGLFGIEEKKAAPAKESEGLVDMANAVKPAVSNRKRSRFASSHVESGERKSKEALDIAIIGVSGRYPQANNIHEFWKNLRDGKDCITEIPKDRWDNSLYFDEDKNKPGKTYSKWGGFIEDVDKFDPLFFNISPREAELMDPQERLFLQCVFETLGDAGYTRDALGLRKEFGLEGNVGVYVGVMYEEYQLYGAQEQTRGRQISLWGIPSSIANRVSYYCNFHGPSIALDTMCSSSLTAIHLACQSLQRGGCEMAIAGGVNVSVHPNKYLFLSQGKFVSSKGRCESFGQGGDGYVPGEGVGAVLLKPLLSAIADGDHIYGVIKATAINHGGKTNGYTVPNPSAQASVIGRALKESGIDPRTISYLEAHGTGTSLGDPIEIAGLNKIFGEYTKDKQFCVIGSAKSNIGHCESAAGIAGVTKVLLQLKHRQLVPSLHSETLNPNIDFSNTPFVVQQELAEWQRPKITIDGEVKEYPRIAGISGFGAGGSNAHVIIEEYIPKDQDRPRSTITTENPAIIVLSARDEDRLKEQAQQLLSAIQEQQFSNADLPDMAYTLQTGREAMEERLAVIVGSIKDLEDKLQGFVEGKEGVEDLYRGQVKRNKETLALFAADEEFQETLEKWIKRGKYSKLLDLWVKGLMFDWNKLYGDAKPHRISLPTYSFARERYWVPEVKSRETGVRNSQSEIGGQIIHPLLHQNTSDLSEQRFSSIFTGREFFLTDHVVKGNHVLPGVAYLEMARAAVEQAAGALHEDQTGIRLKNVGWTRPIVVGDQPVQVHIGLFPEDSGEISYEIYSRSEENGAEPVVYSQGIASLSSIAEVPKLDLHALKAQCTRSLLMPGQCYEAFKAMGLEYGPAHQGIEKVYVGQGQVLAKLSLPSSLSDTRDQFVLHPGMMDSALQASIGLMVNPEDTNGKAALKAVVPFALQELEIISKCTSKMWSFVRYSNGSKAGDKVQKLDIEVCDEDGKVCVRLKGFTLRVLEGEVGSIGSPESLGTLMLEPSWKEQAVAQEDTTPDYAKHLVMLCEPGNVSQKRIEAQIKEARCITLQSQQNGIEDRFQSYATQVFEEIQSILNDKPKGKVLVQIVVPAEGEQRIFVGLSGFLKTARLENPKMVGQLIEVEPNANAQTIIEKLKENSRSPRDTQIRYQHDKRSVAGWREIESAKEAGIPWKDHGIYLITGGAGGLGLIFAKEIAQNVKDATLILTGRSPLKEDKQAQLKKLQTLGGRILYKQVDVTRKEAVADLIQNIKEKFGNLNGIIHAAGVIRDNFIIKKTKEEFGEVLTPKVSGLVNLDQVSKDMSLDFFIFFSSITGGLGNIGQCDYATANAFMDAYAQYRNNLAASNQRKGQTLSINWPLWKEGGMHVDEATKKLLRESMGMIAMQTPTGIRALYQGLASQKAQVMVMEGELKRLHSTLLEQQSSTGVLQSSPAVDKTKAVPAIAQDVLKEKAVDYFKDLLSSVVKLPAYRIETDAPLEKYGIDSVMVMQLTNELEKTFGSLSKTLFFEYQNLQAITGYFLESHRDQMIRLLEIEGKTAAPADNPTDSVAAANPVKTAVGSRRQSRFAPARMESRKEKANENLDVAIVGISGRYPQAKNIEELWKNLRDGKDCITEVPTERWDHHKYYDPDKEKLGKSYSKWGGFIDDVDKFDASFFDMSPVEAMHLDPQDRLVLETVSQTLEDAGYTRDGLENEKVGVYLGAMYGEYLLYGLEEALKGNVMPVVSSHGVMANRISYYFGFEGPSMAVDTLCSSSITAIHLACESIRRGECGLAVAGGVNISIHWNKYHVLSKLGLISSDGKHRSFGEGGDGYVPGEGVGAVLLKPVSAAIRDGDHIYAVIKGSSLNAAGKRNGFMVPNPNAQTKLILETLRKSRIDPRTIGYIEAFALGTALGDPIEIAGLSKAFSEYTEDKQYCSIGAGKTNTGHLESASGMLALTKVLLQMRHKQLVPSLNSEKLNPNIHFEESPFYVQHELAEWKQPVIRENGEEKKYPRRAGITAYGAGGAYGFLLLEEYEKPAVEPIVQKESHHIIVISAKNTERLREYVKELLSFLEREKENEISFTDLAYTLQIGREAMEERLAVIVSSVQELREKLSLYHQGTSDIENCYSGNREAERKKARLFFEGRAGEEFLGNIIRGRELSKIAQVWASGAAIDWKLLYSEQPARRISLPTYPFARERYWMPGSNEASADTGDIELLGLAKK